MAAASRKKESVSPFYDGYASLGTRNLGLKNGLQSKQKRGESRSLSSDVEASKRTCRSCYVRDP